MKFDNLNEGDLIRVVTPHSRHCGFFCEIINKRMILAGTHKFIKLKKAERFFDHTFSLDVNKITKISKIE